MNVSDLINKMSVYEERRESFGERKNFKSRITMDPMMLAKMIREEELEEITEDEFERTPDKKKSQ